MSDGGRTISPPGGGPKCPDCAAVLDLPTDVDDARLHPLWLPNVWTCPDCGAVFYESEAFDARLEVDDDLRLLNTENDQ